MAAQIFSGDFAGEGQTYPEDQWPIVDLNPEEWREIEDCPALLAPKDAPQ